MSAIITDPFKKQFMQKILDEVTSLDARYYIGIGKNDEWNATETVPTPTDSPKTIREAQNALQSVKAVAATSFVIPRHNWSSGSEYSGYDDKYTTIPSNTYYVLTDDNHVYICLQQSKSATGSVNKSTVKPTGTSPKPFKTSDGYTWRFLYGLSGTDTSSFLSANFIPVKKVITASNPFETQQKTAQDSADAGRILNIVVENQGSGYTGTPTVTITGNSGAIGDSAQATAFVSSNKIVKIDMLNESAGSGKNFVNATVTISGGGGSGATARAVLGPPNGIGADPRDDLKSTSLMFNSKPDGTENGDFLAGTGQDFRQVLLIRNPKTDSANGNTLEATTAKALKYFLVDSAFATQLQPDELITSDASPIGKAYVNEAVNFGDANNMKVYYHQTDSTGYTPLSVGDLMTDEGGQTGTIEVVADSNEQYINTSGEVLYIENRAPVTRNSTQTEDIKVVVTL